MEYGKNTVGVYYKIKKWKNKAKLTLAPIINFRDFHTIIQIMNLICQKKLIKKK